MFDSYSSSNNSIKINAVSGTLTKNYKDSFIVRFYMNSKMAEQILSCSPYICTNRLEKPVVVLQVMLCADNELIAELMWKSDFDKMFKVEEDSDAS